VASSTRAVTASLASTVAERQARLNATLRLAHNSASGVSALAQAEVSAAGESLDLLGLLTARAGQYRAKLNGLLAAVRGQHDPTQSAVQEAALHDEIALLQADAAKTIPAKMIVVSTEDQYAHVYQNGKEIYTTPVTTGGPELPTDHGVFHIYMKASPFVFHSPWPPGSPYYYPPTPITYWIPFDGAEGLHDASWRSNFGPGSNFQPTDLGTGNYILGTHGCVNLPYDAATFVWNWAPVGTTVVVV
jgi:lipoprotein-anchoring transpeptidase ErfK/SrfK